jgi:hypothetical protein
MAEEEVMEDRSVYSEKVGERYLRTGHGIRFDSGIEYTNLELKIITEQPGEMLRAIHAAKEVFRGAVISAEYRPKKDKPKT